MARYTRRNSTTRTVRAIPVGHTSSPSTSNAPPPPPPEKEQQFKNNCSPLASLIPFASAHGFYNYRQMGRSQKLQFLKTQVTEVDFDELHEQKMAHLRAVKKIETDPELRGYYEWSTCQDVEEKKKCLRILGQKAAEKLEGHENPLRFEKSETTRRRFEMKFLDMYKESRHYQVPPTRFRISGNLPLNSKTPLKVFSDVPGEEGKTVTDALIYDYRNRNYLNGEEEALLKRAVDLAEEPENLIRCDCCSQSPIVSCYENPDCPCFQINFKLQKLQGDGTETNGAFMEFKTFNGTKLQNPADSFYRNVGFACSAACSCRSRCTNNATLLLEKQLFELELTRSNMTMGFGVRTLTMIPAGTPIMEFTGELKEFERMDEQNQDYAFQVSYVEKSKKNEKKVEEKALWKIIKQHPWSPELKKVFSEISRKEYFVDPKFYGNIGRTCLHSCAPNCETVRIYQKSLSPAHLRLIFVALEDIYPGSPLTIDYGPAYIDSQFGGKCLCGTFACKNGQHSRFFKNLDFHQLAKYFTELDKVQGRKFKEMKEFLEQQENVAEPMEE